VAGKRKIVLIFDLADDMVECPDPSYWHDYFLGLVDAEIPIANDELHEKLGKSGHPERVCG
jgi:hypothetical protein